MLKQINQIGDIFFSYIITKNKTKVCVLKTFFINICVYNPITYIYLY